MIQKKEYKGAILALDTASEKTGYAIYKDNRIVDSGTWILKDGEELAQLYKYILQVVKEHKITKIIAEDIYKSKDPKLKNAYNVLAECRGIVKLICQLKRLECIFISPIIAKQYIWKMQPNTTLTRPQQKQAMLLAVQRYGYQLANNRAYDEADAIGLLITCVETNNYILEYPNQ